jgi:uncharacterized membrane protein YkvA (DUF1232 family)
MAMTKSTYANNYSSVGFWNKIKKYTKRIGEEVLEKSLTLYFALDSPKCSATDKAIIYGALGYLISPIDLVPDLTPALGYTDDAGVIAGALVKISGAIDSSVKEKARKRTKEFFS